MNGRDGQSVTTITERGISNNSNGIFVRTYKVDHEGIKQDLISETFVSDGKDGKDGKSFSFSDLTEEDFKKILDYGIKNNYFNSKSETDFLISNNPPLDKNKIWIDTGVDE